MKTFTKTSVLLEDIRSTLEARSALSYSWGDMAAPVRELSSEIRAGVAQAKKGLAQGTTPKREKSLHALVKAGPKAVQALAVLHDVLADIEDSV